MFLAKSERSLDRRFDYSKGFEYILKERNMKEDVCKLGNNVMS